MTSELFASIGPDIELPQSHFTMAEFVLKTLQAPLAASPFLYRMRFPRMWTLKAWVETCCDRGMEVWKKTTHDYHWDFAYCRTHRVSSTLPRSKKDTETPWSRKTCHYFASSQASHQYEPRSWWPLIPRRVRVYNVLLGHPPRAFAALTCCIGPLVGYSNPAVELPFRNHH
jgi:hypothetical protein